MNLLLAALAIASLALVVSAVALVAAGCALLLCARSPRGVLGGGQLHERQ